jgi:hypothetical protein
MKKRITLSGLSELRKWAASRLGGLSGSVEKGKLMEIYCYFNKVKCPSLLPTLLPAILILYIFPSCILPQCQLIQMKMNGQ